MSGRRPPPAGLGVSGIDLALLAVTLIWGLNSVVVKRALSDFLPLTFNALRFSIATALIFLVLYRVEGRIVVPRGGLAALAVAGFLGNTVYQAGFIIGLSLSSAGNVSFVLATIPASVALLAHLLGQERLPARGWAGLGVTLAGAVMIVLSGGGAVALSGATVRGDLVVLAGTLGWSMYTILSKRLLGRFSPLSLTAWTMALGTAGLLVIAAPELLRQDWARPDGLAWLSMVGSAALALVFSYVVWNWGLSQIGTTRTAVYGNLTPLWTGFFGWLLLGETWGPVRLLGGALILLGVGVVRATRAKRGPSARPLGAAAPPGRTAGSGPAGA